MESDISLKDFETWKRKFSDYLVLTGLNEAQRETQVATLRGFLSSDMYDKLRISVGVEDDTELTVEEILELIRKFIRSKRNIALDRVLFEQRRQLEGEDFETFLVAIRQISENADLCEGHCQDCTKTCIGLRIATKIVSGIKDAETRTKCLALKAEEFNVDKVVDVCRTEESAHKNEQNLSGKYVHKVSNNYENKRGRSTQRRYSKGKPSWRYGRDGSNFSTKRDQSKPNNANCPRCGYLHIGKPCPAKTKQCNHCKKTGHFEKLCRMKLSKDGGQVPRIVVGQIHLSKAHTVKVQIRNKNCTLAESEALLDYGADISLGDLNF